MSKNQKENNKTRFILVIVGLSLFLIGSCVSTKQAQNVESSGFLGDIYPMMREGNENEALLVYHNPRLPEMAKRSGKILLDPVTIWRGEESQLNGMSEKEIQHMADRFYSTIYSELDKDYAMVEEKGPDTILIQVALTKLKESKVALNTISSVLPQARLMSYAKEKATGKVSFVGEASIEVKITNSETGELIVAAVDRRVGGKKLDSGTFNSWGDVYAILDFWAKGMRFKLCEARGDSDCVKPDE